MPRQPPKPQPPTGGMADLLAATVDDMRENQNLGDPTGCLGEVLPDTNNGLTQGQSPPYEMGV
jgi:hypothetical protein